MHDLLDRLLDGDFSEADRLRLNELLAAGTEQRRYYLTYMDVHSRLAWDAGRRGNDPWATMNAEVPQAASAVSTGCPSFIIRHLPGLSLLLSYGFAAILFAVAVLAAWTWTPAGSEPRPEIVRFEIIQSVHAPAPSPALAVVKPNTPLIATVTGTLDCQWAHPEKRASDAAAGRLAIASGLIELTYNTGVKVVLQGPAEYQLEWPNGGILTQGKVIVRIEESRKPSTPNRENKSPGAARESLTVPLFAIRTPNAMMTYTSPREGQFEVSVDNAGGSCTRVVRGSVALGLRTWWPSPDGVLIEEEEAALVDFTANSQGNVLIFGGKQRPQVFTHDLPQGSPIFSRKSEPSRSAGPRRGS